MSDEMDSGDEKPSRGAVTSVPCTCRYLERSADEPSSPIVFDAEMNEYHLTDIDNGGTGMTGYAIIRHCPWCGGTAPRSKRDTLFANITTEERHRLKGLTAGVKTFDDAIAKFGEPNEDHPAGHTTMSTATDTEPSIVRSYRVLRYAGLSETANVTFTDSGPERPVWVQFESKYVGERKG